MNFKKALYLCLVIAGSMSSLNAAERIYDLSRMGLKADSKKNASPVLQRVIKHIQSECAPEDSIVLRFSKGKYNFHETGSAERIYYISNHDQTNPKRVGIAIGRFQTLHSGGERCRIYLPRTNAAALFAPFRKLYVA